MIKQKKMLMLIDFTNDSVLIELSSLVVKLGAVGFTEECSTAECQVADNPGIKHACTFYPLMK